MLRDLCVCDSLNWCSYAFKARGYILLQRAQTTGIAAFCACYILSQPIGRRVCAKAKPCACLQVQTFCRKRSFFIIYASDSARGGNIKSGRIQSTPQSRITFVPFRYVIYSLLKDLFQFLYFLKGFQLTAHPVKMRAREPEHCRKRQAFVRYRTANYHLRSTKRTAISYHVNQ